jgi:CO/xanthine dehydrogenase Mo-binding subunit
VEGFLRLTPEGRLEVFSGKVDLGTGVRTALSQMVADEIEMPIESIDLFQGDTAITPDQGPTYGSLTVQNGGAQLREAAATLRQALVGEAAQQWKVEPETLHCQQGRVRAVDGRSLRFQELVAKGPLSLAIDSTVVLKDPARFEVVGRSVARPEVADMVTGGHQYVHDFRRRDMVHARVVRPNAIKAHLKSFDDSACKAIPGYLRTVRQGDFLAVVAEREWSAILAAKALRAEWTPWAGLPEQAGLWKHVRTSAVASSETFQRDGDARAVLARPPGRRVRYSFDFAIHTHGSIGPSCAVAEWEGDAVTVWTASQQTHLLRKQLATMLSIAPEQVRCIYLPGSGCYGRNGHEDAAADAVLVSRALGRPARVQWMRADEHGWDPKGPPTLIDYEAELGPDGQILAWRSLAFLPSRAKEVSVALIAAEHAALPHEDSSPGDMHQALAIPYRAPNRLCEVNWLAETPLRPSWIRAPGRMQNTFGNESVMDALAVLAEQDPIAFRRHHLDDARGDELLERLAKFANWQPRVSGSARSADVVVRGRGVSYVKYELVRTYVGLVIDLVVDRSTGVIRVEHCHVAHDCGQIINPDGLRNQIEGNILQTLSRTLLEEVKFDRSRVTSVDWESYPILRYPDVPEIAIHLINRPHEKPWGAGAPSAAVVPAAIANAVFDATGVRLVSVPFTPAKVLAALQS